MKAIAAVLALNHEGVDPKNAAIEGRYVAAIRR